MMLIWLAALYAVAGTPAACALPPGWDEIASRNTRYVVFGELHGTEQAPDMFGSVACALAGKGERVLVSLEIDSRENPALQSAWALPHDRFEAAIVRDLGIWKQGRDGRSSVAMLAMIVRLHAAKSHGAKIDVVAFNGARDEVQHARFASLPGQGPHDAAQAENIRLAADGGNYDRVLVLVGNVHARKRQVAGGDINFEPMAMKLAPAKQVTSRDMAYAAGTAWNCGFRAGFVPVPGKPPSSADIDCSARPTKGLTTVSGLPRLGIGSLQPAHVQGQYDGWFWVGPITASPPAIDASPAKN